MRATASKILLLLVPALFAPAASARSHKAPAHVPAAHSHAAARVKTAAHTKAPAHGKANGHARSAVARAGHAGRSHERRTAGSTAAAPEPAQEQAPIHVTHDRKHHLHSAPAPTAMPVRGGRAGRQLARVVMPQITAKAEIVTRPRVLAEEPDLVMPVLEYRRGRLVLPAALKGSHEILLHQNEMADRDGLGRVQDDADLLALRGRGMLVALPVSAGLHVDERLPYDRRYARPWAAAFLADVARAHYARFHAPLQVNSAVRTVEFQQRLLRTNGNAAPADGDTASPHLTGQAIDLAKHGLSMSEIAWMRAYLLQLTQEGKIDVEEEFQQACFHISVYRKYLPVPAEKRVVIPVRNTVDTLAAAVPAP